MTEHDLSDQPPTDGKPATEAPVVAGAGETFDALESRASGSSSAEPERDGSEQPGTAGGDSGSGR
jgi:hypothetical protein